VLLHGSVGSGDYGFLASSYGAPATWGGGSLTGGSINGGDTFGNGPLTVGSGDYGLLASNYGLSVTGTEVADGITNSPVISAGSVTSAAPEPASLVLLGLGGLLVMSSRRRRHQA